MLSDIMSHPVITVSDDTKMEEAAVILRDMGCSGAPVVDKDGHIVGILSRRDFEKTRKPKHMHSVVKAFMNRNVITISNDKSVIDAVKLMIKHDIGRIPVRKHDKIVGIITRSDVMMYFYDLMPD